MSGAVITSNGKLTPSFEYIAGLREAQNRAAISGDFSSEKKVIPIKCPFPFSITTFIAG